MFHERLTDEDRAIFLRAASRNRDSLPADYMVMLGDATDHRMMRDAEELRLFTWKPADRAVAQHRYYEDTV
jgi:hypothetical protein